MLDADEHLHLGLHAISVSNHHEALNHLHRALALRPGDVRATYLLAVQHAELGLVRRGIEGLQAVLSLDPAMEMARFQLGLMLLDASRAVEGRHHLEILTGSSDFSLQTFAVGVIALVDGKTEIARQKLGEGLALQPVNPALAAAMGRLLDGLTPAERTANEAADPIPSPPMSLGAYASR